MIYTKGTREKREKGETEKGPLISVGPVTFNKFIYRIDISLQKKQKTKNKGGDELLSHSSQAVGNTKKRQKKKKGKKVGMPEKFRVGGKMEETGCRMRGR